MKVMIGGRRTGKTTFLVGLVRSDPSSVLVVATHWRREDILRTVNDKYDRDMLAKRIITPTELFRLMGRGDLKVYVDELQDVFSTLLLTVGGSTAQLAGWTMDLPKDTP